MIVDGSSNDSPAGGNAVVISIIVASASFPEKDGFLR
jgi:hypothetical protein